MLVIESVEGMEELLLGRYLTRNKLDIVYKQDIAASELVMKPRRIVLCDALAMRYGTDWLK